MLDIREMNTVIEEVAPGAARVLPRSTWRDILLPIVVAVLLLTAIVAIAMAISAFGADPMTGT